MAEALGQFGDPEEEERLPLETGTIGLVKRQQTEKIHCVYSEPSTV
jgi:hypothetical protein